MSFDNPQVFRETEKKEIRNLDNLDNRRVGVKWKMQKYTWITTEFFEKILKREFKDPTVFVKTFQQHEINGRHQNYWCDMILVEINYVNSLNVTRYAELIIFVSNFHSAIL